MVMDIRMNQFRQAALMALILLFAMALPVQAVESTQNTDLQEEYQIIFLIDGSYSMAGE